MRSDQLGSLFCPGGDFLPPSSFVRGCSNVGEQLFETETFANVNQTQYFPRGTREIVDKSDLRKQNLALAEYFVRVGCLYPCKIISWALLGLGRSPQPPTPTGAITIMPSLHYGHISLQKGEISGLRCRQATPHAQSY